MIKQKNKLKGENHCSSPSQNITENNFFNFLITGIGMLLI